MTPERGLQVERIYHEAEAQPPGERASFLDHACDGDAGLRTDVERMLAGDSAAAGFPEAPTVAVAARAVVAAAARIFPGSRLGPYEIVSRLGAGGMGEVYRARDTRLGRTVAIKVVNAEFTKRFEREAKAISALNHPHICTLHDVGEHEGAPYLVMEYVEGQPLNGPLPVGDALCYAIQTAQALAAAHQVGIVHRDLKPDNILLTSQGNVKVLDFGLAKLQPTVETDTPTLTAMTEQGIIAGTGPYMSPEQAQGEPVDARSDIFSFGAVLYELLSGRRAFRGESLGSTLAAVITAEPPPLKEAPAEVARIVGKMLAKKREARYQSAEELLADLRAAATGAALLRRRLWLALAAALLVLIAAVVGFDIRGMKTRLVAWMKPTAPSIRLAVLPFANLSGDPEQEYLSDGVTQEMITQLGSLHPASLSVIARTSVMRYKKSDKSIDEVGRELRVDYILEGSARREAGRVRITAELIQVRNQTQLWAESFERDLAGILALQAEVARKVAGALALKLLPAEQVRLAKVRPLNPEAYEAYLKGIHYRDRLTKGDIETAERYFTLALQIDPNYAAAHAGIARVWTGRQQALLTPPSEAGPKAKAAARKAMELDETEVAAHRALAAVLTWTDWNWAAAEKEWKRTIELDPGEADARAAYSHFLMHMGRPDEAMVQIKRALELDRFSGKVSSFYVVDLNYAGRFDEAIAQARNVLRMDPGNWVAINALIAALHQKGMEDEVLTEMRASLNLSGDRPGIEALDRGYREAGHRGAFRRLAEHRAARFNQTHSGPTAVAIAYIMAGDHALAVDWLEKAYEARDPNLPYIGGPDFAPVRSEPRFQTLLRRMNLPQ
jgi:eukaryotic-like serine/threonine-protein kinase